MCDQLWDATRDQDGTSVTRTTDLDESAKIMPSPCQSANKLGGCPCLRRRSTRRCHILSLGHFSLASETTTGVNHLPGCPRAKYVPVSTPKAVQLLYSGLRRLISAAIVVSVSLELGGGDRTISPDDSSRPLVDGTTPDFRVMALLRMRFFGSRFAAIDVKVTLQAMGLSWTGSYDFSSSGKAHLGIPILMAGPSFMISHR